MDDIKTDIGKMQRGVQTDSSMAQQAPAGALWHVQISRTRHFADQLEYYQLLLNDLALLNYHYCCKICYGSLLA